MICFSCSCLSEPPRNAHLFVSAGRFCMFACVCETHPGRYCSSWRWSLVGEGPAGWNDIQTSTAWCFSPACWLSPSPPCSPAAGSGVQEEVGSPGGKKGDFKGEIKTQKWLSEGQHAFFCLDLWKLNQQSQRLKGARRKMWYKSYAAHRLRRDRVHHLTWWRRTWLSIFSSCSVVLCCRDSMRARIPVPVMKLDSTLRLFSVVFTFSTSARAWKNKSAACSFVYQQVEAWLSILQDWKCNMQQDDRQHQSPRILELNSFIIIVYELM